jgi:5-(carboxyamino)imidazole ribonucleotide mutase
VGIDASANAGLLAVRILSIKYPEYAEKLERYREKLREKVLTSKVEY